MIRSNYVSKVLVTFLNFFFFSTSEAGYILTAFTKRWRKVDFHVHSLLHLLLCVYSMFQKKLFVNFSKDVMESGERETERSSKLHCTEFFMHSLIHSLTCSLVRSLGMRFINRFADLLW